MPGRIILGVANPSLDSNGKIQSASTLTYYENLTTTLQTIYADFELTTPLTNPLPCDASGVFPQVWAPDTFAYSVKWSRPGLSDVTYDNIYPAGNGSDAPWLWSEPVISILGTPPSSPAERDRYLVAATGTTGVWVGNENNVTEWNGAQWIFTGAPLTNQTISVAGVIYQFNGTSWLLAQNVNTAIWALPVLGRRKAPPPSGTSVGDRYLVHTYGQYGAWVGYADQVAECNGIAPSVTWIFSGAAVPGQMLSMNGVHYEYQLGLEEEATAGSYFWRSYNAGRTAATATAAIHSFGDSITIVPDGSPYTTNSWPARFARNLDLTLTNHGISGTGFWSAAGLNFTVATLDSGTDTHMFILATGHNNALQGTSLANLKSTAFNETLAMLCHAFGTFTPASSGGLTTTGTWNSDTTDALGLKPISHQSSNGNVLWSTTPGSQINGFTFNGENFILHTFRGDGIVSGNSEADIDFVIDSDARTPYTDDGLWQLSDGSHMGHAVYWDNKWGAGTHAVTVQVGANATVAKPCYIDGFTVLRPPGSCNPFFVSMPLRPTDLTPTTSLSGATATDANFDAVEAGIKQAVAYFNGYPIQLIYPNEWLQNPADFEDLEHPSSAGTIFYARAAIWASKRS